MSALSLPDHRYSTSEAAEQLGVSVGRVRNLCARGDLPAIRSGSRRWKLEYMDIYRYGVEQGLIHDRFTVLEDRADELERQVAYLRRAAEVVGGFLLDIAHCDEERRVDAD